MLYKWQGFELEICGYSDSDWAGCHSTGKSTSGGSIMRGSHFLKGWCTTQQCITLSSAEAELVALNKCGTELLGVLSMYADYGATGHRVDSGTSPSGSGLAEHLVGVVCGDSSAALAASLPKGCGKNRHIRIGQLWTQERINAKELN